MSVDYKRPMIAIDVKNLSKQYGAFTAIDDLSFQVQEGSCLGLLGSNGAGKSTTIKIIIGQLKPSKGSVDVLGVNPTLSPKAVHPHLGYIPDKQSVYEELTVKVNIDVFRKLNRQPARRTMDIIEELDLTDKVNAKVKDLSKGLRQRVLIARALIHTPKIIVLDEPTSGLDPSSAETIYGILERLKKKGSTLLLTTHLMNDVERLCDKIVFLNSGKKVAEGSPLELKRKHRKQVVNVQTLKGDLAETHEVPMTGDWVSKVQSLSTNNELISIHSQEPKLEDVFIKLVRESRL